MSIEQYDHQEIVRQTVYKLSLRLAKGADRAGLSHPLDESSAKGLLKAMVERGVIYSADEVSYIAQYEFQWSKKHADKLGNVAEKISNGGRVQGADTELGKSMAAQIFQKLDDLSAPK